MNNDDEPVRGSKNMSLWERLTRSLRRRYFGVLLQADIDSEQIGELPGGLRGPGATVLVISVVFALFRLGIDQVYTESLLLMSLGLVFGVLSRTTGWLFLLSFGVLDLLASDVWVFGSSNSIYIYYFLVIGRVISYWVLYLLVIRIPDVQRLAYVVLSSQRARKRVGSVGAPIVSALIVAGLIYLWTVIAPYLIRPVFSHSPSVQAIEPLQYSGWILAVVGGVSSLLATLTYQRRFGLSFEHVGMTWRPLGAAQSGLKAMAKRWILYVFGIVALSGLVTSRLDILMLFGALLGGDLLFSYVIRNSGLGLRLLQIGYVARFGLALSVTFLLSYVIFTLLYKPLFGSEFFPFVLSLALGFLVFNLLLGVEGGTSQKHVARTGDSGRTSFSMMVLLALVLSLVLSEESLADNCSGLSDCAKQSAKCISAAVTAIVLAVWSFINGVWGPGPPTSVDPLDPELAPPAIEGVITFDQSVVVSYLLNDKGDLETGLRVRRMNKQQYQEWCNSEEGKRVIEELKQDRRYYSD